MATTVLERLLDSLHGAANLSRAEQIRPAAVLWTDHEGRWLGVAERLRLDLRGGVPARTLLRDHRRDRNGCFG